MGQHLALSIPAKRVTAWMAETGQRETRAWLNTLPTADSAECARELYQALYTLNRQELNAQDRFGLMELYQDPVGKVTHALQHFFSKQPVPLNTARRQLAEFVRSLQMEMANGYKCTLYDIERTRFKRGKKNQRLLSLGNAMHYLGEVLLRSYQVYMPYPSGIWQEIHEIYRYAAEAGLSMESFRRPQVDGTAHATIYKMYLQILLFGLSNPYQLHQDECYQIYTFLDQWAEEAKLTEDLKTKNIAGQFLIDLENDSIPVPYARDNKLYPLPTLLRLDAAELAHKAHTFQIQLRKGKRARDIGLGIECLESNCVDLLKRMVRVWGLAARRQYSRTKKRGFVSLCAGINALHFFSSGQKPFTENRELLVAENTAPLFGLDQEIPTDGDSDEDFIDLDEIERPDDTRNELTTAMSAYFRLDRWRIKDESAGGLLLTRSDEEGVSMRVGDLIGIQGAVDAGQWRAGVVRWLKSPRNNELEMGIELLSPDFQAVAVKAEGASSSKSRHFMQALMLPAIEALRRPKTLVLQRGIYHPETNIVLDDGVNYARVVRPLKLVERTNSFEQIIFADVRQ